ncbi:MAG TPA: hypothetical protein VGS22_25855 [Thermoanaerobaculia bacterium]|nr:hypothetical protein [Thermoanaerobaculia bacterium]
MADRRQPRTTEPRAVRERGGVLKRRSRIERLIAFFRPKHPGDTGVASLLLSRERFIAAQTLVAAYYAVLFFFAAGELFSWPGYLASGDLVPRWPVFWLRFVDAKTGIAAILWLHLLGGILGVTLARYRWARVVVFVSLLEFLAFKFSFGAVNHGDHMGVLVAFVLIFLPAGWHLRGPADRTTRASTLLVFSGTQALILLTYSMAGMWKAGGVLEQWIRGEFVTYLHPQGLAYQVAAKMIEDDAPSMLGPWLVAHPWAGWLPGIAMIYLELFALWVVARPSLHRAWGLGLALFHLGSHLALGVGFPQNILWLSLFLVLSPFQPQDPDWRRSWRSAAGDLPLFGRWLRRFERRAPAAP